MNRGDTVYIMLNYQLNGEDLVEGAYQEIELQINAQGSAFSVKKLYSKGEIEWQTLSYIEEDETKTFTGYIAHLSQEESFMLLNGTAEVQLRIMISDEVGSSAFSTIDIGKTLSKEVLKDD